MKLADWQLAECLLADGAVVAPLEKEIGDFGPLHSVLMNLGDRPDVMDWLLQHGAQVDRRGPNNLTPLMHAIDRRAIMTVPVLLAHHADVNASTLIDEDTPTLHFAAERGLTQVVMDLLARGANGDRKDGYGRDAATIAERAGHAHLARLLRDHKLLEKIKSKGAEWNSDMELRKRGLQ